MLVIVVPPTVIPTLTRPAAWGGVNTAIWVVLNRSAPIPAAPPNVTPTRDELKFVPVKTTRWPPETGPLMGD